MLHMNMQWGSSEPTQVQLTAEMEEHLEAWASGDKITELLDGACLRSAATVLVL